jgi:hypothetical protein
LIPAARIGNSPPAFGPAMPELMNAAALKGGGRWWARICLLGLIGIGIFLSFDRITKQSLWGDEFWAVYLATGRGNMAFDLPREQVIQSPPAVGFASAPHLWHIWTGLGSVVHPPGYYIALRLWVDLFGDSDLATRALSAVCGLTCAVMLFRLIAPEFGQWAAVATAGLMVFSPLQIDFRQQVRPYTMLTLVGLLLCGAVLRIERRGVSRGKLVQAAALSFTVVLTHYFGLGTVIAIGCYVFIAFKGSQRNQTLGAIAAGIAIAAILWGPVAWETRHDAIVPVNYGVNPAISFWKSLLNVSGTLLVEPGSETLAVAIAIIVILVPAMRLSRRAVLFWWLWVICTVGLVAAVDLVRGSVLVSVSRYVFLASPGVFALLCSWVSIRLGRFVLGAAFLSSIIFGVARWQAGPSFSDTTADVARVMKQMVPSGDVVIVTGHFPTEPAFRYILISHYLGNWINPLVLLSEAPSDALDRQLQRYPHVWVVGYDPGDMRLLPGWKMIRYRGISPGYCLFSVAPADSVPKKI